MTPKIEFVSFIGDMLFLAASSILLKIENKKILSRYLLRKKESVYNGKPCVITVLYARLPHSTLKPNYSQNHSKEVHNYLGSRVSMYHVHKKNFENMHAFT